MLDYFNRQTYLGNSFSLPVDSLSLGMSTDETPILLIENPTAPAFPYKALFMNVNTLQSSDTVLFRFYFNPTISANGTPETPLNLRPGSNVLSVSKCYVSPTISDNGTLFTLAGNGTQVTSLFVLDQGSTLLITAQATDADTSVYLSQSWYEV